MNTTFNASELAIELNYEIDNTFFNVEVAQELLANARYLNEAANIIEAYIDSLLDLRP